MNKKVHETSWCVLKKKKEEVNLPRTGLSTSPGD